MNVLELQQAAVTIAGHSLIQATSLTLYPTTMTALIGPNGAGKTSLLRLFAGLWPATTGQVLLNGKNINHFQRIELARYITFVPQETAIHFALTVREVVTLGRHPHRQPFSRLQYADHECVTQALTAMDLTHLAERPVTQLSAGERQRVALARSLATESDIILLDEPVANLDIAHTLEILHYCQKLAHTGKTIVFSIHDINLALRYAEQILLIHQGHLLAQGSPATVLTQALIREVFGVHTEAAITPTGEKMLFFQLFKTIYSHFLP